MISTLKKVFWQTVSAFTNVDILQVLLWIFVEEEWTSEEEGLSFSPIFCNGLNQMSIEKKHVRLID